MSKLKIAFDIGSSGLKIAVSKKDGVELYEFRLPENIIEEGDVVMPNALSEFLKDIRKKHSLPKGPAGLVLPTHQALCKTITMPVMTEDQLMLNLPYWFNDFIQEDVDKYYYDYALCEDFDADQPDAEMTLMGAVVLKSRIAEYIKIFSQAGFQIKKILPQEMVLINLVNLYGKNKSENKECCFVELGHSRSRMTVIGQSRVKASKQIALAGKDLDDIICEIMNVDSFVANTYKRKNQADILNNSSVLEFYDRVAVEVLKGVNFYNFAYRDNHLDGLFFIGGGSNITPLKQAVKNVLEIDVLSIEDLIPADNKELCGICACAAGMILASEENE